MLVRLFVLFGPLLFLPSIPVLKVDDVPIVDAKLEDLRPNLKTAYEAWKETVAITPRGMATAILTNEPEELQRKVDQFVTAVVTINPESRVKVQRGPYTPELAAGWPI